MTTLVQCATVQMKRWLHCQKSRDCEKVAENFKSESNASIDLM